MSLHALYDNLFMSCPFIWSADREIPKASCWGLSIKEQQLLCWRKKTSLERRVFINQLKNSRRQEGGGEGRRLNKFSGFFVNHMLCYNLQTFLISHLCLHIFTSPMHFSETGLLFSSRCYLDSLSSINGWKTISSFVVLYKTHRFQLKIWKVELS